MIARRLSIIALALTLGLISWQRTHAQATGEAKQAAKPGADSQEAERNKILQSDRWQQMLREFNEWISVQQVYTDEQLLAVRKDLGARTARMSPRELQVFLKDMEDRLAVLASPEAKDARIWLGQFLAVARDPDAQLGRDRPDVLNMTASQIRQEIAWLDQYRASRQQSHAAFQQGRAIQKQSARGVQDSRRAAHARAADLRTSAAAKAQARSQYVPRPQDRPNFTDPNLIPSNRPIWSISPWGTPVHWHPFHGPW